MKLSKKQVFLLLASTLLAVGLVSAEASGQTLGSLADNVRATIGNIAKLLSAGSYVCGIGFALAGMMKFKAHKDNPQQVPLSAPIVLLAVAAGLIFLPSIIDTTGTTIFGASKSSGKGDGSGLADLGGGN